MPEIPIWISIASAVAAWVAVIWSFLAFLTSRGALRLAEQQEARRRPHLAIYLDRCFTRRSHGLRKYNFLLSVSNPTDSDNAIAAAHLRVVYRTPDGFLASVDVPATTVAGWMEFSYPLSMLDNCAPEKYSIVLTDSHSITTMAEALLVLERINGRQDALG